MKLKTFSKGGIHPPEHKLSADKPIEDFGIPKRVTIPLTQHIGATAKATVTKGDRVLTGQLIGVSNGFISANVHSSVTGKVVKLDNIIDVSGFARPAVVIDCEDADEWVPEIDTSDVIKKECSLSAKDIVTKISDAGIVGLGGATFPSHVKFMIPEGKKAECLVINGVECEPYLTADHRLMLEQGEQLMLGASILMKAINVPLCYIGIENNKKDAIAHLEKLSKDYNGVRIVPLKVKYPQGGEKQLIKAVTGKEVPSGALPLSVGAVVSNVGSVVAVYEAVQKNKPLVERIVTVTGKGLAKHLNLRVRVGTPIEELLERAGGLPVNAGKVISGGPMMGRVISKLSAPSAKGVSGVLVLDEKESKRPDWGACIRCCKCTTVCPMGLEPHLLMVLSEKAMWAKTEAEKVMDCIECGSCSYTCPANRPLLDYIRLGKKEAGNIIKERNSAKV
ncbi:MAG: electron transport complex subunit RsxC [Bacteroidales bacterium]